MTTEIRLEKISDTMESATVVRWLKQVGDKVAAGEVVVELETDKVTVELEAPQAGVIARIAAPDGSENVPVGALLAVIEPAGEAKSAASPAPSANPERSSAPSNVRAIDISARRVPAQPERRDADEPSAESEADFRDSRATMVAVDQSTAATPLARAMARVGGIDLASVRNETAGAVTRTQVERALGIDRRPREAVAVPKEEPAAEASGGLVRLGMIRKLTAARMAESKQKIPHFYLSIECDVGVAVKFLEQVNREKLPSRVTFTAIVIKAAAAAIRRVPAVNAEWTPNHLVMREINISIGVATPGGLIAPVIRRPDHKTLIEIAVELEALVSRAKNGQLNLQDTSGGTFTISNLGMFGVDALFPIITPGQSGVLGIGASREQPAIRDGAVVAATIMQATFSGDHRALDGAQGAEFLRTFKEMIEQPARMIL
ncbi:MAG TPA: dihydrolipoamide acetyltransferase family protein [Candidatus Binataceae bacterium]|nr:dihydrolipoamide acetyltransferase family protein [Candidatus Binataceae bacterium]